MFQHEIEFHLLRKLYKIINEQVERPRNKCSCFNNIFAELWNAPGGCLIGGGPLDEYI